MVPVQTLIFLKIIADTTDLKYHSKLKVSEDLLKYLYSEAVCLKFWKMIDNTRQVFANANAAAGTFPQAPTHQYFWQGKLP